MSSALRHISQSYKNNWKTGTQVELDQCWHCWFFSLDLGFWGFYWKSGFFDSGQILEMYVVLLYFPFKKTIVSKA